MFLFQKWLESWSVSWNLEVQPQLRKELQNRRFAGDKNWPLPNSLMDTKILHVYFIYSLLFHWSRSCWCSRSGIRQRTRKYRGKSHMLLMILNYHDVVFLGKNQYSEKTNFNNWSGRPQKSAIRRTILSLTLFVSNI